MSIQPNTGSCCAAFYASDFARMLLGESFHPGGVALTRHLGELLRLTAETHVLDVASGPGTSAFCLAEFFGCEVTGVDLSHENVQAANAMAERRGVNERVRFLEGSSEGLPLPDAAFDAIICECAFCTFGDKPLAAREFHRVLRHDGRIGLSDLTRTAEPLPGLDGLLASIACIADAQPADRYAAILTSAGFAMEAVEDHSGALVEMVRQIEGKLLWAEIMTGLRKLDLPGVDLSAAKRFAQAAMEAIRASKLGYAILTGTRAGAVSVP